MNRLGFGIMSDSNWYSSTTYSETMCEKITNIYSRQGTAQKSPVMVVRIQCQAMLIARHLVRSLLNVSKTAGLLAKTHANVLIGNKITQMSVFAIQKDINMLEYKII